MNHHHIRNNYENIIHNFHPFVLYNIDYDLHTPQRQTDYYITPAALGFETMAGEHASFFIELGMMYGITGMEFGDGSYLYKKDWFPVFKIGTALRSGKKTGVYYAVDTKPLAIDRQRRKSISEN